MMVRTRGPPPAVVARRERTEGENMEVAVAIVGSGGFGARMAKSRTNLGTTFAKTPRGMVIACRDLETVESDGSRAQREEV